MNEEIFVRIVGRKHDFVSWVIRLFTRSWASHAEFIRVVDGQPLARFGSNWPDGVKYRDYDTSNVVREEWYTAPRIKEAYLWAIANLMGHSYNLPAIFGVAFNKNWTDSKEDFCSQVIDVAFRSVDAPVLVDSDRPWTITPRDLLLSPVLTKVKEIRR